MIYLYLQPLNGADGGPHYQGPERHPHMGFHSHAEAQDAIDEMRETGEAQYWTARIVELDAPPAELVDQLKRLAI